MTERPIAYPPLKRGEGSWGYDDDREQIVLRHYWPPGAKRQHVERGETFDECERKRDRRRRDLDVRASVGGDGTLGGLLAAWYEAESRGKSPRTVRTYNTSVDRLLRELGDETRVWDLTVEGYEEMMARVVAEGGLGTASLTKLRCHFGMALGFGLRRELIPAEVVGRLRTAKPPAMPPLRSRHVWFDLAEFETVRAQLVRERGPRNVLFLVMLLCGLRPGEAVGLKWEFVDLDARVLQVEGQVERFDEPSWTPILKTDHLHEFAHREVPIPADLALVLGAMERLDDLVFIETAGKAKGRLVSFMTVGDHARAIALAAKVKYVNPNGYRHTFASVCRARAMPYEVLARLMGHQDAREIIATYGHPVTENRDVDLDRYLGTPEAGS